MNMHTAIKEIKKILKDNSSKEGLDAFNKFIPGAEKVYGVRMPVLNELAGQFKEGGFDLVRQLWDEDSFEEKMIAAKLLGKIAKKDPVKSLQLVEYFAPRINDWAICDTIGMQSLKPIVKTHQKQIFALAKKYNSSTDLWERRLSLVLVEWYTRDQSLHTEIMKLITPLENDPEYYVRKAVAWIKKKF